MMFHSRLHSALTACLGLCVLLLGPLHVRVAAPSEPVVRASSLHPGPFAAAHVLDGEASTRWASGPFSGQPQWLEIDFGRVVLIDEIVIRWEHAFAPRYRLDVSVDGERWETIHTEDSCRGGEERIGGLGGSGRFLRVTCLEPSSWGMVSIWELEFTSASAREALAAARQRADKARREATHTARQRYARQLAEHGVSQVVFAVRQPGKDGHWYANFGYYADSVDRLTYGDGGRLDILDLASGEITTLLDDPEGGIRDPVVHYDAQKILFAYRRGGSAHYHLYEIGVDGSQLRQLTDGPFDDIEPCYLPDDSIVFVSSRCRRWVQCWLTHVAVLHRCDAEGGDIRMISANVEHDNTPWPLPDGRILFQRWEYVDRSQVDYHHLWTANPDGTGQMVYFGNQYPGTVMIDAKPVPGSRQVVASFSPGHGIKEHDGQIALVDPRGGPDDVDKVRYLTDAADYRDPWAFSETLFLAARRDQLVLFDGEGQEATVYQLSATDIARGLECHEPRPIVRRTREGLIPDRVDRSRSTGTLLLTDVYQGRNMEGIERGEIKKLLVLESLPKPINFTGGMDPLTYGGSFTLERVLGEVPVDPDGSAHFEVPAMRSLLVVAMDENDLAVKRMHSFLTVQPGERLGCVGCHDQRTESLTTAFLPEAFARPADRIQPISGFPDVLDFPRDIQPILDRHCVACHGSEATERGGPYAGGVLLEGDLGPMFSHAYFTMTVRRLFSDNRNEAVSNLPTRSVGSSASRILTMGKGEHYGVVFSARERRMLQLWIDVGAPYPGTYGALGTGSIGGYFENTLVNTDFDWPTTVAGAEAMQRRCAECHQGEAILPAALSDERDVSFWRFDVADPRLRWSRHIVFNLSRPEQSLLVRAPLAKEAGGLAICRDARGEFAAVFADRQDRDYQQLLQMVEAGRRNLEEIKRFHMPDFQPRWEYLREMRRFGILPPDSPDEAPADPYQLDRRYWESFWLDTGRRS